MQWAAAWPKCRSMATPSTPLPELDGDSPCAGGRERGGDTDGRHRRERGAPTVRGMDPSGLRHDLGHLLGLMVSVLAQGLRSRVSVPAGGDRGRGPLGTCAMGCRTSTSRSWSPNSASTSTTSPCSAGCSASRRCSSTRLGPSVTRRVRWFVDETHVRVAAVWRYVYRAVDQFGHRRLRLHASATWWRRGASSSGRSARMATRLRLSRTWRCAERSMSSCRVSATTRSVIGRTGWSAVTVG